MIIGVGEEGDGMDDLVSTFLIEALPAGELAVVVFN